LSLARTCEGDKLPPYTFTLVFDKLGQVDKKKSDLNANGKPDGPGTGGGLRSGGMADLQLSSLFVTVDGPVARLTLELARPVPVAPLEWRVTTTRPGRKVSLLDVELRHVERDLVVARARALRIRRAPVALPHDNPELAPRYSPHPRW